MKRKLLLAFATVSLAYGGWSLYVANRYQALCELSYFAATSAELKLCDERLTELTAAR